MNKTEDYDRQHLKVGEVADVLRVAPMTVHNLISTGQLKAINTGTGKRAHWRISRQNLDAYLEAKQNEVNPRFGGAA